MRETGCVKNGVTCNGQGECKCNKCSCNDNYQGPYCKTCADCNDCKQIAAILQSGDILEKKLTTSSDSLVTNITHHDTGFAELLAKKTCPPITDRDGCYVQFKYNYDEDGAVEGEDEEGMDYYDPSNLRPVKVMVSERACPASIVTPTNTVVSILAIGILSLIFWKIVTYFHDKGEYEKFLKEIQSQAWKNETNPLFQSPETEIRNPAYNPHEN
ncbi:Integrin beta-2 [Halotydeus destructor]|nr:Integrin beta-2 [Halotydeus destructor]